MLSGSEALSRSKLYTQKDHTRKYLTKESGNRSPFRRDNGRLIHSASFRRLQGKTQLFPGYESDFFRNRLTHSLEVAQIAKGIAESLNATIPYFKKNNIDLSLVETAALAHDLGHPPFGHNGEMALDEAMLKYGGFEGNAQTLRILAKLEKKVTTSERYLQVANSEKDHRCGLNLTYRTLASVLKYDNHIPPTRDNKGVQKGYYYSEKDLVSDIKNAVLREKEYTGTFKVVECQIMDIADDIAYSTYDLEDAFKAGFLSPLGIVASDPGFLESLAEKVKNSIEVEITKDEVSQILIETYEAIFPSVQQIEEKENYFRECGLEGSELSRQVGIYSSIYANGASCNLCENGYVRTDHTSKLVNMFINGVRVDINKDHPCLSKIKLDLDIKKQIEVLKRYTYQAMILSPRLKISEFRGFDIVTDIFDKLVQNDGHTLLPPDSRELYDSFAEESEKKRVICDFIAGMTDRYAVEFYSRLHSETPQTIFKPF